MGTINVRRCRAQKNFIPHVVVLKMVLRAPTPSVINTVPIFPLLNKVKI
jgi:hypothetical protein